MAVRQYTVEQLLKLRESPLVSKPDNLPAIEQWIEYVYLDVDGEREKLRIHHSDSQKQQQARRAVAPTGDASPMGNFSAGQQRPGLVGARSSAVARSGEDVSLGPPRTVFASSRSTARLSDFPSDSVPADESDASRGNKAFGEKQATRKSGTQEPDPRFSRESWTAAREKRITDGDAAEDRNGRYGRRDRDTEGDRRNGFGDRQDPRWTRDAPRTNGDRTGTWRRGEKPRPEREWDRSGHLDKEPEWMDDPAPKDEGDLSSLSMPKNQEDFEKWKQAQHARNKKSTDESATKVVEPPPLREPSPPPKPAATLKLDTLPSQSFHDWGKRASTDGTPDVATPSAKPAPAKAKTSRFMPMFKKDEIKEETPPPPVQAEASNGTAEDKEGFQRILQMLGGTGIGQAAPPPPPSQQAQQPQPIQRAPEPMSPQTRQSGGEGKQKSRFTGFFDSVPRSPEALHSPPPPSRPHQHEMPHGARPFTQEAGNVYSAKNSETQGSAPGGILSPEPMGPSNGIREQRPQSSQMQNLFLDNKPPSRGAATPDINIQNLLASQRNQRQQEPDKNSQFLLNLLQAKGSSRPPSQQTQVEGNFPLWLDQPPNSAEPQMQKPRQLPPAGHLEEQLMRASSQGPPRPDSQHLPHHEILQRRTSQNRPGQGFYDEQAMFMQQQQQQQSRRSHAEPQHAHQMSRRINTNLPPQMQMAPQLPGFQYPPEFLQSPGAQPSPHTHAPPPGFNAHMPPRHPPGIHNGPNLFQAPHQPREQPPPGFGGPNGPPPPGFFAGPPPPGFMQMRSPTEVRGNGRGGMDGYDGMGQRR